MIFTRWGVEVKIVARAGGNMVRVEADDGWAAWRHISDLCADGGLTEIQIAITLAAADLPPEPSWKTAKLK